MQLSTQFTMHVCIHFNFVCSLYTAIILLSSENEASGYAMPTGGTPQTPHQMAGKRKSPARSQGSQGQGAQGGGGPNTRPRKERQLNWSGLEVMALIAAKEYEHEVQKLSTDPRELMETTVQKWSKLLTL
jgi:hypothetical protein